jgi:hypothetical protein
MKGHITSRIIESDAAESALHIFAELERSILDSTFRLADAADIEHSDGLPPKQERVDALRGMAKAVATDSFAGFWRERVARERYESTPPERHVGAGADSDVWLGQVERWADGVRDQAGVDGPDRELADRACREVYGVGIDTYEAEVIELNESQELERVTAGNFRAAKRLIDTVAEDLRDAEGEA